MDTDKEGSLTPGAQEAIGDAAKANVNAAVEVAKSAVTAFVDTLIGEPQKPKRRSTRKKAATKATGGRRGKAKRVADGRKPASATGRKSTRKSPTKRRASTGRTRSTRKSATSKTTRKSSQATRTTSNSRSSKTRGRPPRARTR